MASESQLPYRQVNICASLEMTTKWIPAWLRRSASGLRRATPRRAPRRASKPPISPSLTMNYDLFMQNKDNVKIGKTGTEWQRHIVNFTPRPSSIIPHPVCLCASAPLNLTKLSSFVIVFMQNKANLRKSQVDVAPLVIMNYEEKSDWTPGENEPKTNPIKPKQSQFARCPNERKFNINKGL